MRDGQECVGVDEAALTVELREGDELGQVSGIHIHCIALCQLPIVSSFMLLHSISAAVVRREEDEAGPVC